MEYAVKIWKRDQNMQVSTQNSGDCGKMKVLVTNTNARIE